MDPVELPPADALHPSSDPGETGCERNLPYSRDGSYPRPSPWSYRLRIPFWRDTLRFARKLTLQRVWNALLLLASYGITRLLKRPIPWGLPMTVSLEPTTACNLRCPECPSGLRAFTRPTGTLSRDLGHSVIDQIAPHALYLIFYFQGEPYIHPRFLDLVRHAHSRKLYTITSTNGHFLDDERARATVLSGLDRLIISVDGTTQDTYAAYRREGNLQEVLDGARRLVYWRKKLGRHSPHIIFQFLVVRPNEHEIPEIYRLAREIGVDEVRLKTAQVYDYTHGNPLIPSDLRYSRYLPQSDGTWQPRHALNGHCWKLWHACVVTWNGQVVPCCFDKDASHPMGDLRFQSLRDLWRDAPYRSFRNTLARGRNHIDICTNCTEGCHV
jgi:radical SAM protein with 4Fe4S-binding SPASM domain